RPARATLFPYTTLFRSLNSALAEVIHGVRPTTVFIPFRNDMHMDHQRVFDSAMVALRPLPGSTVREIYAYETLSETNWHANSRRSEEHTSELQSRENLV